MRIERAAGVVTAGPLQDGAIVELKARFKTEKCVGFCVRHSNLQCVHMNESATQVEEDGDDKLEEEEAELQALLVPASSSSSSSTASSRLCKVSQPAHAPSSPSTYARTPRLLTHLPPPTRQTLLGACLAADSSLHQTLLPHLHARSPHPLALLLLSRPQEGRGSLLALADAEGNAMVQLSVSVVSPRVCFFVSVSQSVCLSVCPRAWHHHHQPRSSGL